MKNEKLLFIKNMKRFYKFDVSHYHKAYMVQKVNVYMNLNNYCGNNHIWLQFSEIIFLIDTYTFKITVTSAYEIFRSLNDICTSHMKRCLGGLV